MLEAHLQLQQRTWITYRKSSCVCVATADSPAHGESGLRCVNHNTSQSTTHP